MTMDGARRAGSVLAVVLLVFMAGADVAQAQAARRQGPPARAELERRVRERFEVVVREELGLSEADALRLRQVVVSFREPRRELGDRHAALRRMLARSDTTLARARAEELLAELVDVQRQEARLMEREIERLLTVLEPAQVVRFYALRERMAERMRSLQDRFGPPGRRGGGGPPGG